MRYNQDYDGLKKTLWEEHDKTLGVSDTLRGIHQTLIRPESGLLDLYEKSLREGLASSDESKDINTWYLTSIHKFLAGVFIIQLEGLALEIFMSSEAADRMSSCKGPSDWFLLANALGQPRKRRDRVNRICGLDSKRRRRRRTVTCILS